MMNYKVRVANEAESKEVQGWFFELGYGFYGGNFKKAQVFEYVNPFYFFAYQDKDLTVSSDNSRFSLSDHKELTIPQLRDKVVLHRNDVSDSNASDKSSYELYIDSNEKIYFYFAGEWRESDLNFNKQYIKNMGIVKKPIGKEEMKEYLRKNDNGTYSYIGEVHHDNVNKNMVEVPEGAEAAFLSKCEQINFVKDGCFYHDGNWDSFKNESDHYKLYWLNKILWQRNPPVDAVFKDDVNHPSHYDKGEIECIDAIESSMSKEAFCGYLKGNVQKYMWRYENKGGVESLQKAKWYLNKLIEKQN